MDGRFEQILLAAAAELGIVIDRDRLALFETYRETLLLWNSKMNLVSLRSEVDLPVRHFIDSLTLLPFLPSGGIRLLDIGSGAGFPSIPLKIFRPDLQVTLLEASRKKCSFLKEVIRKLALKDIAVAQSRLEELLSQGASPFFDMIVSRATFKMNELLERAFPLLGPGGILAAMKGPGLEEETGPLDTMKIKEFRILRDHSLTLPITGDRRRIILVDKPC